MVTKKVEMISTKTDLLADAQKTAVEYSKQQINPNTVGIAFLGAIARGYFDEVSDIDISIFEKGYDPKYDTNTLKINGFELHYFKVDYETEKAQQWDMGKRWAYSNTTIFYDPDYALHQLIQDKVPLKDEERRWLLMSGITLSEWYINRLTELWVKRGSILSAHHMFHEGINHFFNALFALNNELVADYKWRVYCAERLKIIPSIFQERLAEVMKLDKINEHELDRRRNAFMRMWEDILPKVENELQMKYSEFKNLV